MLHKHLHFVEQSGPLPITVFIAEAQVLRNMRLVFFHVFDLQ